MTKFYLSKIKVSKYLYMMLNLINGKYVYKTIDLINELILKKIMRKINKKYLIYFLIYLLLYSWYLNVLCSLHLDAGDPYPDTYRHDSGEDHY
jgi:hypothetical protein